MYGWHAYRYLLIALLLLSGTAQAQSLSLTSGIDRVVRLGGGSGSMIAGLPTPSGAYSFRKVMSGYGGKPMQLQRASDSAVQDIGFIGSNFDTAAATTFCAATTCTIAKWYDQSGNGRDMSASGGLWPALLFSCIGAVPCIRMTFSANLLIAASITPATGLVSFGSVSRRSVSNGLCFVISEAGANSRLQFHGASANYGLLAAGGPLLAAQTEGQWHATSAVVNGVSSNIVMDGTTTTGNVAGSVTAGQPQIFGVNGTTCDEVEAIFWDNYALTAPQAAALNTDQHTYWGF